jgi:hypothetical protein
MRHTRASLRPRDLEPIKTFGGLRLMRQVHRTGRTGACQSFPRLRPLVA